jgi:hypothetical protein
MNLHLTAEVVLQKSVELFAGTCVAWLTAYLTVRLAFRRFYSEKRWEQKRDAYTKLLTALHQMKEHAIYEERTLDTHLLMPPESDVEAEWKAHARRVEEDMRLGISELRLQLDIGTFVIAKEATVLLETLLLKLDQSVDFYKSTGILANYYSHRLAALNECRLGLCAVADQELSKGWT